MLQCREKALLEKALIFTFQKALALFLDKLAKPF